MLTLLACTAGLAVVGSLYLYQDAAARAFRSDPSCIGVFPYGAAAGVAGACRFGEASITRAWTTYPKYGHTRHLQLETGAGTRSVALTPSGEAVWHAARDGTDRDATIEWYRGDVVALATRSGSTVTSTFPSVNATRSFAVAMVLATIGLVSALRILLSPS
jgi:hypothetical protein